MEKEKDGPKPEESASQEGEPERQDVIYDLTAESVSADEVKAILEGRNEAGSGPEAGTGAGAAAGLGVEELRRERDEYYDKYLRAMADLDNMRKRVARERAEYERYATENLFRRLLTVVDNFRRAIEVGRECREFGSFFEGIELISRQMLELLESEGVELFESTGDEFDPSRHDAIYTVETDDHPPDMVVEEIAPGYLIGERVLRPAQVVVSKQKQAEPGPEERDPRGDGPAKKAE
jgi:molecular chaperone GrpE